MTTSLTHQRRAEAGLTARGLRWRAGPNAALLLTVGVAALVAATAAVFLASLDASRLRAALNNAPPAARTLTVGDSHPGRMHPTAQLGAVIGRLPAALARRADYTLDAPLLLGRVGGQLTPGELLSATSGCTPAALVSGRCPTKADDIAVAAPDATTHGWTPGSQFAAMLNAPAVEQLPNNQVTLTVVGVYRPGAITAAPGTRPIGAPAGLSDSDTTRALPFLTPAETLAELPDGAPVTALAAIPFSGTTLTTAQADWLRRRLPALRTSAQRDYGIDVGTALQATLDRVHQQGRTATAVVLVAAGQALLVTLGVLVLAAAAAARARRPEIAARRLRGEPPQRLFAAITAEPAAVVLVGAGLGAAASVLAGSLITGAVDVPVLVVPTTRIAVAAIAAVVVAGLVVAAAVTGALTRPLDTALAETTPPVRRTRWAAALDTAAVVLAGAGLAELAATGAVHGDQPDAVAALTPTLLGVALAVFVARLVPLAAHLAGRVNPAGGPLSRFLACRRLGRGADLLPLLPLVGAAVAVVTFGIAAQQAATANRSARAAAQTGAHRVVTVQAGDDKDLLAATRRADPDGRWAMAAVTGTGGGTPVLAVDTTRLAAVAAWRRGDANAPLPRLASRLRPHLPPSLQVSGTHLHLVAASLPPPNTRLQAQLVTDRDTVETVTLGPLRPGGHDYRTSLPTACARPCRLTGLTAVTPPTLPGEPRVALALTVTAIGSDDGRQTTWLPRAAWAAADRWRGAGPGDGTEPVGIFGTGSGVIFGFHFDPDQASQSVVSAAIPAVVPGLVADTTSALYGGAPFLQLARPDGTPITVDDTAHAHYLPRAGRSGVLVDLATVARVVPAASTPVISQVWLSAAAPADATARLTAAGLRVVHTDTAAQALHRLDQDGLVQAFTAFVLAAAAAAAMVAVALISLQTAAVRRRSTEAVTLRGFGVTSRQLRRAFFTEDAVVVVGGALAGTAAALAAARWALPSVPEFTDTFGPPPAFHTVSVLSLAAPAALTVLLLGTAWLAARTVTGGTTSRSRA